MYGIVLYFYLVTACTVLYYTVYVQCYSKYSAVSKVVSHHLWCALPGFVYTNGFDVHIQALYIPPGSSHSVLYWVGVLQPYSGVLAGWASAMQFGEAVQGCKN